MISSLFITGQFKHLFARQQANHSIALALPEEEYVPFDTSVIQFQGDTSLVGFNLVAEGGLAYTAPFMVKNTSTSKTIAILHMKLGLATPDARIIPNEGTFQYIFPNAFLVAPTMIRPPNQVSFDTVTSAFLGISGAPAPTPEVYDVGNSFILLEVAGLAYEDVANGVAQNVNFASLSPGIAMESWKITPNTLAPFSGTCESVPS